MRTLIDRVATAPKWAAVTAAYVLTGLIGAADAATGHDFVMGPLYIIPVCWVCWAAGRGAGVVAAAANAGAWLVADLLTGHHYSHVAIPYWNALTLFVLFAGGALLLAAFQSAQHNLEATVRLRTAALQESIREREILEQAKLQAERLATVGSMAATVAHEVRNPLGSITLNLDLIEKEIVRLAELRKKSGQEGRELVQEMRQEVRRIRCVIDDYLQFAHLPRSMKQVFSVNELLTRKLAAMAGTFELKGIRLRTEFDPDLNAITGDADQIWQAMLNLIQNSLDAMPDGGDLVVSTRREGRRALLCVTDTGSGMGGEQRSRVFQPFFTTKAQGTGLGLALVQQVVTDHGGHVECDSEEGRGSTFRIVLRLAEKT
jgi:signal transduction histidine kinase